MATKKKSSETKTSSSKYRSVVAGLGNAVGYANEFDAAGYDVQYCFAVVANDEEGKPVQGVYILAKKRDA